MYSLATYVGDFSNEGVLVKTSFFVILTYIVTKPDGKV